MSSNIRNPKVRVLIVDDHSTIRKGIVSVLEDAENTNFFEVVGSTESGYEALILCQERKPDIIILDLHLGAGMSGFEVIHEIRLNKFPVRIVVFTGTIFARNTAANEMWADAYLIKDVSDEVLVQTLKEVAAKPVKELNVASLPSSEILTIREVEVLRLAAKGLSHLQIAQEMNLEKGTISVMLSRIYVKIDVTNQVAAVAFALRHKLIE